MHNAAAARRITYNKIKKNSTDRRPSAELRSLPVLPPLESGLKSLPGLKSNAENTSSTVYTVHKRGQSAVPDNKDQQDAHTKPSAPELDSP